MRSVARLHPDPLRELTALPRPPRWIKEGDRGKKGRGKERKKMGKNPNV